MTVTHAVDGAISVATVQKLVTKEVSEESLVAADVGTVDQAPEADLDQVSNIPTKCESVETLYSTLFNEKLYNGNLFV